MLKSIGGLMLGLVLSAGAALAQTSIPPVLPANPVPGVAPPPAGSVSNAPITDDTIVCKYERDTGTLFMIQVCRTQRAWKIMQADAQEFMEFGFRGSHQKDEGSGGS
ncbi:MAG TPA: hypothetical protein VJ476_07855 [Rhizomicrobium sp.]|nr:hypothetical protein [Rhizomicrobium sp.]